MSGLGYQMPFQVDIDPFINLYEATPSQRLNRATNTQQQAVRTNLTNESEPQSTHSSARALSRHDRTPIQSFGADSEPVPYPRQRSNSQTHYSSNEGCWQDEQLRHDPKVRVWPEYDQKGLPYLRNLFGEMKPTRIFPRYQENGDAYIRQSENNGLDRYTGYRSGGPPSEKSQEFLRSTTDHQSCNSSPQNQQKRYPEAAVSGQGSGVIASVIPSSNGLTDRMSRTMSRAIASMIPRQDNQQLRFNPRQSSQETDIPVVQISLARSATAVGNGMTRQDSQLGTSQRSRVARPSPAPSRNANRSSDEARSHLFTSTSQARHQSPGFAVNTVPSNRQYSPIPSGMRQQEIQYQQAGKASKLSDSLLNSNTPQLSRSTTPVSQSRDSNRKASSGIRPADQSYALPMASKQTVTPSPPRSQMFQGNHAGQSIDPYLQNMALARTNSPFLGHRGVSSPQTCGATYQMNTPFQTQAFHQKPTDNYQQLYAQAAPQPGTQKRSREATNPDEVDLLNLSKRARGPLGQAQTPSAPAKTPPNSYIQAVIAQTGPLMMGNRAPPVLPGQRRGPLAYVADPKSRNARSAYSSPYIPGSTIAQTTNIQQTSNNNTPVYSLYGQQYSSQMPTSTPSVRKPPVWSNPNMSHKKALDSERVQQNADESGSYQRPYVLDNVDIHCSEPPPPVISSQEEQPATTKEQSPSLPRPPTYYEHTGGTLTSRPPWETGVCANMDFKTKSFIDAHGADFSTDKCGGYRYVKPTNRVQELAIIPATYQTIADFELYLGFSPQSKIKTWENYNTQYRQLQSELMTQWTGPPELIPKLRYVEGWYTSHADHSLPTPPEPDSAGKKFAWCKPGNIEEKPCYYHNYSFWQGRGCVRRLEEQYWEDHGNAYFAKVEATSTHVSAGNYAEEDWKERLARMERGGRQGR